MPYDLSGTYHSSLLQGGLQGQSHSLAFFLVEECCQEHFQNQLGRRGFHFSQFPLGEGKPRQAHFEKGPYASERQSELTVLLLHGTVGTRSMFQAEFTAASSHFPRRQALPRPQSSRQLAGADGKEGKTEEGGLGTAAPLEAIGLLRQLP